MTRENYKLLSKHPKLTSTNTPKLEIPLPLLSQTSKTME